jgi:hypothetical protein
MISRSAAITKKLPINKFCTTFASVVQRIIAFILFLAFLGQTFNQGWYYLDYLVEKREYMKRCENKSRPQMHCNGKCQLMKKIQAQQEKEQGQPPELKLATQLEIVAPVYHLSLTPPENHNNSITFVFRTIGSPIHRSVSLFHPPDVA